MSQEQGDGEEMYMTIASAARYVGATEQTLRKYVWKGRLKVGMRDPAGRIYFTRAALDDVRQEIADNKAKYKRSFDYPTEPEGE